MNKKQNFPLRAMPDEATEDSLLSEGAE